MKKTLLLSIGIMGWLAQSATAQTLYTTTNDFAMFNGGAGVVSDLYYSDSSTVNGIGNASNPGGAGGIGSLQLTATGGWGWLSGSDFSGPTAASFSALSSGSTRPWSPESGGGAGTMVATSGTITFDLYGGNFTDWNWWGIGISYDNHWDLFFASTSSNFTGADGRTWTHFVVPYTTYNASLTYFGMGIGQNAGAIAGQTFYVDNIQIVPVPEPGAAVLLGVGLSVLIGFRRRTGC